MIAPNVLYSAKSLDAGLPEIGDFPAKRGGSVQCYAMLVSGTIRIVDFDVRSMASPRLGTNDPCQKVAPFARGLVGPWLLRSSNGHSAGAVF